MLGLAVLGGVVIELAIIGGAIAFGIWIARQDREGEEIDEE